MVRHYTEETLEDRLKAGILALNAKERAWLLHSWEIHTQYPELTMEKCVEKAAQGADNTPDGKAEQIGKPVSVPIITEKEA